MQQLKIVHRKIEETSTNNSKQVVGSEIEKILEKKDRREGKGRVLALSRNVYRLRYTDIYYIESASIDNILYYVRYNPSVFKWCSCKDYESNRAKICKHLYAIEFAIRFGTLKDIDKLPAETKRYPVSTIVQQSKSYRDEEYDY